MKIPADYIAKNKDSWNKRVGPHLESDFYDMPSFLAGHTSLKPIELELLGDVTGKSILHLQCHFGQDSLSLARMGAKVTGADFSEEAIKKATELNTRLGLDAEFICCDIYDLPGLLDKKFDIVFTSYGTIGWLPDINGWATLVSGFLHPGGKFVFAEFHPVVWMFDDQFDYIQYHYFNKEIIAEISSGTYADKDAEINYETVSWNHSMSEVVTALIANGLRIDSLKEYDYSPYNCFNHCEEIAPGKFIIPKLGGKIPMVYSILATKY